MNVVEQQVSLQIGYPSLTAIAISVDDIDVEGSASPQLRHELLILLNRSRHGFALNLSELGFPSLLEMNIILKEGNRPACSKPYRVRQNVRRLEKSSKNGR